ncbi:2-C-methyl-D-erythritol 4-phosphate cytidylyltransferase [Celerinatantimonas sp. YJH-8]|uniref:2-C-methyl-D-erythritol 4-phosphate cytidylyltransferase n=1 Tax=Celerinatantimonas sp. YJH-8 TaxID=3228714 RepID=UPI0038C590B9
MTKKNYSVVIPAAGIGQRMAADCPKQYLKILGQPMLSYSVKPFLSLDCIHQIVIALSADDHWFKTLELANHPKVKTVIGGADRVHSVMAALETIAPDDWVLVHDAARPCLSQRELVAIIEAAERDQGAILACPVRDTMKRSNAQRVIETTINRDYLWHAQTPQSFACQILLNNIRGALKAGVNMTDEASAMEWAGYPVELIPGSHDNIKVTHPEDLSLAEFLISRQQRS